MFIIFRFLADFKPAAVLKTEMDSLLTHLETLGSPVVYGHNDLLPNNIIHNKKKGTLPLFNLIIRYVFLCWRNLFCPNIK